MAMNQNSFILSIVTIGMIMYSIGSCSKETTPPEMKIQYIETPSEPIVLKEHTPFTPQNLKSLLKDLNVRFPEIVYAQAQLESANFQSRIFIENNNMFGMKRARKRPTTNHGEQYGHAYFQSWEDCVLDYAFFQTTYMRNIKTEEDYFSYLSMNYAEDKQYVQKLKAIIKKE
jgi:hypothetical protein